MKQSVTKTAKKSGGPAAAGAPPQSDVVKALESAMANTIAGAPKAKTAAAATPASRPAARKAAPAKSGAKAAAAASTAQPGVDKSAAVKAAPTTAAPASQGPRASTKKTAHQQAVKASETGARTDAVASVTAELADKMKTSVVSKVSEVMTKTTKSTPAQDGRLITEDEIRAMGEKDYMNPAQLAFFKARLQQLEKDLLKNAGETTEHLRETVLVPDPADRATIEEEHALELRTRDRERKLLKKVQQSIAAIDGGDYGWCEETGEPIGIPRLIARPTATLSLEAQQRRELKQKLYGD
jgi:DnaK suppressor protein